MSAKTTSATGGQGPEEEEGVSTPTTATASRAAIITMMAATCQPAIREEAGPDVAASTEVGPGPIE
jgi:hypothetical protein